MARSRPQLSPPFRSATPAPMARPAMPPYSASCAMIAVALRRVCTSTTSAASWSFDCARSLNVSVCSVPAFAAPATSRAANGAMKSFLNMDDPRLFAVMPEGWGAHASVGNRTEHHGRARYLVDRPGYPTYLPLTTRLPENASASMTPSPLPNGASSQPLLIPCFRLGAAFP